MANFNLLVLQSKKAYQIFNSNLMKNFNPMKPMKLTLTCLFIACAMLTFAQETKPTNPPATKANAAQDISLKMSNPVAKMISVPIQFNIAEGIGPQNGSQMIMNIQPVIPFTIGPVNLINRIIVPVMENRNLGIDDPNTSKNESVTDFGVSDINYSLYLSPAKVGKVIWGVGPVLSIPTASSNNLGTGVWAGGASGVVLTQVSGLTLIAMVRQIWSGEVPVGYKAMGIDKPMNFFYTNVGGGYAFKSGAGLGAAFEYQDEFNIAGSDDAQMFVNLSLSTVSVLGKQPIQLSVSPRIPLTKNSGDWGMRVGLSFIFPK